MKVKIYNDFNKAYNEGLKYFRDNLPVLGLSPNRTKVDSVSIHGAAMSFRTCDGYGGYTLPVLFSRYINVIACMAEAKWYFDGSSNVDLLEEQGCNFYRLHHTIDVDGTKTVGNYIGYMLRRGPLGDQIANIISELADPKTRRAVINLFSYDYMYNMDTIMPSCITSITIEQCSNNTTHAYLNFRSSDYLVGLPNDVLSMYFLVNLICEAANIPRVSIMTLFFTNVHIYKSQFADALLLIDKARFDEHIMDDGTNSQLELYKSIVKVKYFDPVV